VKPGANRPQNVAMGWLESGGSKRDALEYAKGYAHKHMDAPGICWFETLPFMGGFLWEVQEGGPGYSFLPAAAKVLSESGAKGWTRFRRRVLQVSMMDGKPSFLILSEDMSRSTVENGRGEMTPSGKMRPVVKHGTKLLTFGGAVFGTGATALAMILAFDFSVQAFVAGPRKLDQDLLPHRQWTRVERVPPNLYVETMRYKDQQWTTTIKPVVRSGRNQAAQGNVPTPPPPAPIASSQGGNP
jgi:hypothetical protein